MNEISPLENHSILVENRKIKDLIPVTSKIPKHDKKISLKGRTILPGLIECHTHSLFAGSRANEFRMKLNGATYEEIAKSGGGILSTVEAIRQSKKSELDSILKKRIKSFIKQGVTSLEIKSGYGLDLKNEIKMLEVIKKQDDTFRINIISTFLGAHTIPKEYKDRREKYIKLIIEEMLPAIRKRKLSSFCDVFCESTAFTLKETDQILTRAKELGFSLKIHTDQFTNIGGLELALKLGATSVDHLEVIDEQQSEQFDITESVAVLLPGVSYFLNYKFTPARQIIDSSGIVALATDFNPGSSHISKISFIMNLAALKMHMSVEEIISAYTINAAKSLNLETQCGSIEIGKDADFAVLDCQDYNDLVYDFTDEINFMTISKGKIIYKKKSEN